MGLVVGRTLPILVGLLAFVCGGIFGHAKPTTDTCSPLHIPVHTLMTGQNANDISNYCSSELVGDGTIARFEISSARTGRYSGSSNFKSEELLTSIYLAPTRFQKSGWRGRGTTSVERTTIGTCGRAPELKRCGRGAAEPFRTRASTPQSKHRRIFRQIS